MPELHFRIRWPDGTEERCYSPSTVVTEFFAAGSVYPLAMFLARCGQALAAASERVRAIHGQPCGKAAAQLDALRKRAAAFHDQADAAVAFLGFEHMPTHRMAR